MPDPFISYDTPYNWPNAHNPRPIFNTISAEDPRLHTPPSEGGFYNEMVGNVAPYTESMSRERADVQLCVDVPWELGDVAAYHFLGFGYTVGTQLHRHPPMMHPVYNHLRCSQILNAQSLAFMGMRPVQPQVLDASTPRPKYGRYDIYRMMLNFSPVPYSIKTDGQVSGSGHGEWERHTWIRSEGYVEALYMEGGSGETGGNWVFDNIAGNDPKTNKPIGGIPSFAAGRPLLYAMPKIIVTWYDVPQDYLAKDPNKLFFYDNLYGGTMHTNDAPFLGFPKYTLLADNPVVELRPNPIPASISQTPQFLANVTMTFAYLDPPTKYLGKKSNGDPVTSKGHNMAIYRGDLRWYPFSLDGTGNDDKLLYPTYDYTKFFKKPV